jgi:hypothetical protein
MKNLIVLFAVLTMALFGGCPNCDQDYMDPDNGFDVNENGEEYNPYRFYSICPAVPVIDTADHEDYRLGAARGWNYYFAMIGEEEMFTLCPSEEVADFIIYEEDPSGSNSQAILDATSMGVILGCDILINPSLGEEQKILELNHQIGRCLGLAIDCGPAEGCDMLMSVMAYPADEERYLTDHDRDLLLGFTSGI